jgi:HEAT repeat protein
MAERQLDLLSSSGTRHEARTAEVVAPTPTPVPADLDDATLVAAIPTARLKEAPALAAEAGHRRLPASLLLELMADPAPAVREAACMAVGQQLALVPRLLELARDDAMVVRTAAACALGSMGRREALPTLNRLLREAPSTMVIDAVAAVADEDCVILLARLARSGDQLALAAEEALAVIDHPRARQLLERLEAERNV